MIKRIFAMVVAGVLLAVGGPIGAAAAEPGNYGKTVVTRKSTIVGAGFAQSDTSRTQVWFAVIVQHQVGDGRYLDCRNRLFYVQRKVGAHWLTIAQYRTSQLGDRAGLLKGQPTGTKKYRVFVPAQGSQPKTISEPETVTWVGIR
jgi:hypothetical protein